MPIDLNQHLVRKGNGFYIYGNDKLYKTPDGKVGGWKLHLNVQSSDPHAPGNKEILTFLGSVHFSYECQQSRSKSDKRQVIDSLFVKS